MVVAVPAGQESMRRAGRRAIRSSLLLATLMTAPAVRADPIRAGAEFQVNTTTAGSQVNPAVASNLAGSFIVVFDDREQVGPSTFVQSLRGQRYAPDGTQVGGELTLESGDPDVTDPTNPDVAMHPDGSFVATWEAADLADGDLNVYARRWDATGVPLGPEVQVNTSTAMEQFEASVAVLPGGGFVVVWAGFSAGDPDSYGIFGQRFDAAGAPVGTEFRVNTVTVGTQNHPNVAAAPTGGFVVVWERSYATIISAQVFDASGMPVGGELVVNADYAASSPNVAMGPGGDFVVVWNNTLIVPPFTVRYEAYARRYDASGSPLGAGFAAGPILGDPPSSFEPAAGIDADGGLTVVWSDWDAFDRGDVRGRRFTAAGTPRESPFLVNTYTTNAQSLSDMALTTSGGAFVAVWYSNLQDGDGAGVFGQRFLGPGDTTTSTSATTSTSTTSTLASMTSTTTLAPPCPNVGGSPIPLSLTKTTLRFRGAGSDRFTVKTSFSSFVAVDPATAVTTYLRIADGDGDVIWTSGPIAPGGQAWAKSNPPRGRFRYRDPLAALVPGLFKIAMSERPLGSRSYKLSVTGKLATLAATPPTDGTHAVTLEFSAPLCLEATTVDCKKKPTVEKCS